jgi:phosphoglycolate phosphatase-like HAD superfamily hydrolase
MDTVRLWSFSELLDFIDFTSLEIQQPLRLRNILLAYRNAFPFDTVGEYLDSADADAVLLARLSNCGRKTVADLRRLVDEVVSEVSAGNTLIQQDGGASSTLAPKQLIPDAIRAISFRELIAKSHVSPRLKNSITHEIERGTFPFGNLGEYFDNGGMSALMGIPDFGKKTAEELKMLIAVAAGGYEVSSKFVEAYPKKTELAEQLDNLYPGVFDPLIGDYRLASAGDALLCRKLEKQIQQLLTKPQHAEICQRRYFEETLDSIGQAQKPVMTRERVRQIEAKYKGTVTNIYTEEWLSRAVNKVLAQQEDQNQLPSNDELAKCHPKILFALRKVYLPESHRSGALTNEERHDLAGKFGLDGRIELITSNKRSLEKLIYEVREFAREIGKPDLMPMQLEMSAHGRGDLRSTIGKFGGQSKVANLAGLIYQGQQVAEDGGRTYWTEERIGDFLREVAEKEGHSGIMPTQTECKKHAPNPNTILAVITRGGWYGKGKVWFEIAKHYGLKYSNEKQKVTLKFVREFVRSLGDALHTLTPSEIYVLFEQQGINKSGKNANQERQFDNLVAAIQSGNLPREEVKRWASGGQADLVEALLDPEIESVEDAYASIGESYPKKDHKSKLENKQDDEYREDVEQNLPAPRAIETLASLEKASELLVQTSSDEEAVNFLVAKAAGKLWRRCFEDEASAVEEAKQHQGNQYSELARDTFLEEYTRSKQLPLPEGYAFKDAGGEVRRPKLMQLLIAYKVFRDGRVLNLSGTGTGKTLSAILASRVIGSQLTVISCPNATVPGWGQAIRNAFPDSDVCEKTWQPEWGSLGYPRYLVLNHEMFQDRTEGALKRFIEACAIDFVVIDELHQVKQRDPKSESQRRRMINGLITDVPDNRPKPRVLGMSATPIINNLQEGKSLIELVSSLEHCDIQTETNVQNCMKLYQKFTTMGFRMMPKYRSDRVPKIHPVDCTPSLDALLALGTKPHPQQVEAILVRARWPVISQYLRPKTVVFTDYVKDIIPFLVEATKQAGFSVGVYTGDEKLATEIGFADMLDQFKHGEVDVLLASIKTAGTGIDGLQFICNNVIFATLPWTNTDYEQAVGRFDREGFKFNSLDIHIPKTYAVLSEGEEWSWCDAKLRRIENKRDIAKAAVDGEIPDTTSQLTPEKAAGYWMGWLKRLTEDGMVEFDRKTIRVPLDETDKAQNQRRLRDYGDLPKLRSRWSEEHSHKTHERLQGSPEEWCYFHTKLQEQEREWQHIPRDECAKHIKENLSLGSVVGDFGCGQAQLAIALRDEYTVHSFDHVAISPSVVACDMAHTPLDDVILDVAVYCLSLIGVNVKDYLVEAYRTLKPSGQLLVYHPVENTDRQKFVAGLERLGFAVVKQEQADKWHYIWAIKRGRQADASVEIGF